MSKQLIGIVVCALITLVSAYADESTEVSAALKTVKAHPRLLLSAPALGELKERATSDPVLQRIAQQIVGQADKALEAPPLQHKLKGPRLLHVSRACLDRVYTLALAWRWTGEDRYAEAALSNLRVVCAFPDWNPSHFLDTAEMSHAVGIGYDWLYDYMDPETRDTIRRGLIRLGLEPGVRAYTQDKPWWITSEFNWNQVCNSGLLIGALAVIESDPGYGETIVPTAVKSLPRALASYNPDGLWNEGPGYWNYATSYTAYGLAALKSALGSYFGLDEFPGLARTAYFPLLTAGPTGHFLNFADSGEKSRRGPMPPLFWLSRTFDLPDVARAEHQFLQNHAAKPHHLIWYVPPPEGAGAALPLDRYFASTVPVAVSRSAWDDWEALFLGVKGGYNQVNHGHLDLGNFEMDALGIRWTRDLGSDNYNLPGYWDKKKGGKRWQYYRLNSLSHNVPLIDGQGQDPLGKAPMVRTGGNAQGAFAILDLSSAYEDHARSVLRGAATIAERRAVVIQDEYMLKTGVAVTWAMTTDAEITIENTQHAILTQKGKTLHVNILTPVDASFVVESAERPKPERRNRGVRRLLAQVPAGAKAVTVTVCLRPDWPEGGPVALPTMVPLKDW